MLGGGEGILPKSDKKSPGHIIPDLIRPYPPPPHPPPTSTWGCLPLPFILPLPPPHTFRSPDRPARCVQYVLYALHLNLFILIFIVLVLVSSYTSVNYNKYYTVQSVPKGNKKCCKRVVTGQYTLYSLPMTWQKVVKNPTETCFYFKFVSSYLFTYSTRKLEYRCLLYIIGWMAGSLTKSINSSS